MLATLRADGVAFVCIIDNKHVQLHYASPGVKSGARASETIESLLVTYADLPKQTALQAAAEGFTISLTPSAADVRLSWQTPSHHLHGSSVRMYGSCVRTFASA
jgi:hypothetical protein